MAKTVQIEIKRQASPEAEAVWEKFELPWKPGMNVISAMMDIPRERFVPPASVGLAYLDLDLPVGDAHQNLGLVPDVLYPAGGFAGFSEQIETPAIDHEPDLYLTWQTGFASDRRQIERLPVRDSPDTR